MYEIIGIKIIKNRETGLLTGYTIYLLEVESTVDQGIGCEKVYFSTNRISGDLALGKKCDIQFTIGKNGAFPSKLIVR